MIFKERLLPAWIEGGNSYLEIITVWVKYYRYFSPFILYICVRECMYTYIQRRIAVDHEFSSCETKMAKLLPSLPLHTHTPISSHSIVWFSYPKMNLSCLHYRLLQQKLAWTVRRWITLPYLKWSIIPLVSASQLI